MTQDELADLLPWLQASAVVLTTAGYPTTVQNDHGGVGLIVKAPAGDGGAATGMAPGIGGQWTFFVVPFTADQVEKDIRAWAAKLNVKLPSR